MRISWMGHASFLIEAVNGIKIITDPYESGSYSGQIGYEPIGVEADIVTVTHQHPDHNYTQDFQGAKIIDDEGDFLVGGVKIKGIPSYHDDKKGTLRGKNIIFIIETEGIRLVHFGDLGTKDIDLKTLGHIDIAFIPVGGTFTLDAKQASEVVDEIKPKITIPMHYKTSKIGFDILGVDKFIAGRSNVEKKDILAVTKDELNSLDKEKIVVLEHQR